jgi:hypothetical protein
MRKLYILILIAAFLNPVCFGQTDEKPDIYKLRIPKNLEQCFAILDKTMSDNEIALIKSLPEDSIYYHEEFNSATDFFHAWSLAGESRLTRYFNKLGLYGGHPIYETILVSYHRYLNKDSIKLGQQIKKYQAIQKQEYDEYRAKLDKDTLDGIYIPKNLQGCFEQLDLMLAEDLKAEVKKLENGEATIKYHHGLGTTLRNRWGLWSGSRLQKYFLDRKVNHPDGMSALILKYYYDWLNNKNVTWQKWEQAFDR